jgi:hypothetical protein
VIVRDLGHTKLAYGVRTWTRVRSKVGRALYLHPHLLDSLLRGGAVYEQLALLLLKHHARRKCPALEQRRTPRFPGAVIHLFKLLALAGLMRASLSFLHTVIEAR